jgi:integrase
MAVRERKGRSKPFQVYWRNPHNGRQESRSFETALEARRYDAEIKYRLEFQPDTLKPQAERPMRPAEEKTAFCLEDVYIAYLREKQFSRQRVETYTAAMKLPLAALGRKDITRITEQDLAMVTTQILAADIRQTSACYYARLFFAVLHWARRRHFISQMPLLPELPAVHCRHFVPPSQEELAALYAAASPSIRRVIVLGSKLGLRVGPCEMFRLTWADIDFLRNVCRVPAAAKNKAEPWREVPLHPSILPVLKEWRKADLEAGTLYVVHKADGTPYGSIRKSWAQALRRSGIARHIRPYDLRHAFATDAIAGGADIGTVAKLMGHSDAQMVLQHYQHVLTAQKIAAIDALPSLPLYDQKLYDQKKSEPVQ